MDCITSELVGFNPAPPTFMHIDLNSCFATIEQQANPNLRGKPVAVAAYTTGGGCILAASREAKKLGIKTGMRVREGQAICPFLKVLPPDPNKYRFVNRKLVLLLGSYSASVEVKSIDEMVVDFRNSPKLNYESGSMNYESESSKNKKIFNIHASCFMLQEVTNQMKEIGMEIKNRIKTEIGEWLTVSIGIASNRFLAKTASELHKPDGLDIIIGENIEKILGEMKLEDLCGIKSGNGGRLRICGIKTALGFYKASIKELKYAFRSIVGYHWWLRLHGFEADDREFSRKSFGHSYALYKPYRPSDRELKQILCQLTLKMGRRLRRQGYAAGGIQVACLFPDWSYWHQARKLPQALFAGDDLFKSALSMLARSPDQPVRIISVSCYGLTSDKTEQLGLYENSDRKKSLTLALDAISDRFGEGTVSSGLTLSMERKILDRISFGGVKDLEELVFQDTINREVYL
jgi:DNA polymerase IV